MEDDGGQVTQLLKAMRGGRPAGSPGLAAVGVRPVCHRLLRRFWRPGTNGLESRRVSSSEKSRRAQLRPRPTSAHHATQLLTG